MNTFFAHKMQKSKILLESKLWIKWEKIEKKKMVGGGVWCGWCGELKKSRVSERVCQGKHSLPSSRDITRRGEDKND